VFSTKEAVTVGSREKFQYGEQLIRHKVFVDQEGVGRNHGKFDCLGGQWFYTDLPALDEGGRYGGGSYVKLESEPEKYLLQVGSMIRLGHFVFRVLGPHKAAPFALRFLDGSFELAQENGFTQEQTFPVQNGTQVARLSSKSKKKARGDRDSKSVT
jgi:hypothetical protein